ncbi:MAG: hypothetical protein J07HX5_00960 [halophilic archaeon J07HX5]|nr:MAG: hypothetical protein J07HX5_00960 [halophilic archaeon J07HX5]
MPRLPRSPGLCVTDQTTTEPLEPLGAASWRPDCSTARIGTCRRKQHLDINSTVTATEIILRRFRHPV